MRSRRTLRHWMQQLLPPAQLAAQQAGWNLLRALLVGFTVELNQLARQLDRPGTAKNARQYLRRWLDHPTWEPAPLYARLCRLVRRHLQRSRQVLLLIDTTTLAEGWIVLQVSVPWQRRALPLYRAVYPYAGPERDQPQALRTALRWLAQNLPGPRSRYVLVMDRGFPSSEWVHQWRAAGWRFVVRVKSNWRMEGPTFTGLLRQAPLGRAPSFYPNVVLGWRDPRLKGPDRRGRAHVVQYHGPAQKEPWHLVTSEPEPWAALQIYRQRMQIEQEFRDLKGPLGLDRLAGWTKPERIASFLAWLAVYEWRLAYWWLFEQLPPLARTLQIGGALSWIRSTREWVERRIRLLGAQAFDGL